MTSPRLLAGWHDARTELMAEAKAGLKARVEAELAVAPDEAAMAKLREQFSAEERSIEHKIDHEVHTFSAALDITYNVRIPPLPARAPFSSAPFARSVFVEIGSTKKSAGVCERGTRVRNRDTGCVLCPM